MNCLEFRQLLDDQLDRALDARADAAFRAHRDGCAGCTRLYAHAQEVLGALQTLPQPVPDLDFADRVLAPLHACESGAGQRRSPLAWAGATAAGVAVVVALGTWMPDRATPEVAAGEPVRLVFRSDTALSGVTFELELPDGVELSGYPGQRRLVWQSDLHSGENLLELPLQAGGRGGVVTATLNLGAERRQFSVRVLPAGEHGSPVSAALDSTRDGVLLVASDVSENRRHG